MRRGKYESGFSAPREQELIEETLPQNPVSAPEVPEEEEIIREFHVDAPENEEYPESVIVVEDQQAEQPQPVQAETDPEPEVKEKKLPWQKNVLLYLHDVVYLLTAIIVVFLLFFRLVVVSGDSMYNTLMDGDYLLLLSNTFYHNPKQGDIIVASKESFDNGEPIVKRIIATEGQTVDINFETGEVIVDGEILEETYIYSPTYTAGGVEFPLEVDKGCVFVMGDNRSISRDSRYPEIGQIDTREILGRAIFLLVPGTDNGEEERDFGRIGVLSE